MNTCINCGKESADMVDTGIVNFKICMACEDTGNKMFSELMGGIELGYSDGTKQTLKLTQFGAEE